jgi:glycine/D-amino acid oxidase-like deaminating enzyme
MYVLNYITGVKNEGWFDPWLFLQAFKRKITSMGVDFINAEVTGISIENSRVQTAKVGKVIRNLATT